MKKLFLLAGACMLAVFSHAQTTNTFPSSGNVGIGTISPAQKLEVQGNILSSVGSNEGAALFLENSLKTASNNAYRWVIYNMTGSYGNSLQFWNYSQDMSMYGSRMTLSDNGYVGIGKSDPAQRLDVAGAIQTSGDVGIVLGNSLTGNAGAGTVYGYISRSAGSGGSYPWNANGTIVMQAGSYGGSGGFAFITGDTPTTKMAIVNNGNVLIGKTSQSNTAYKLDVAGKVRADEIVVNSTGADFVFAKDYKLRSLADVKAYIDVNGHLPDVPSAKTMQEEGVGVSELQTKLLQKIEELTLYIIEQDKRIKELESRKSRRK